MICCAHLVAIWGGLVWGIVQFRWGALRTFAGDVWRWRPWKCLFQLMRPWVMFFLLKICLWRYSKWCVRKRLFTIALAHSITLHTLIDLTDPHATHNPKIALTPDTIKYMMQKVNLLRKIVCDGRIWTVCTLIPFTSSFISVVFPSRVTMLFHHIKSSTCHWKKRRNYLHNIGSCLRIWIESQDCIFLVSAIGIVLAALQIMNQRRD